MARSQYSLPTEATGKRDRSDPRGLSGYIRETAQKYGVDPEVALKVAKSEGLKDFSGDGGKSGGAFQLYTGGGLGNEFQKQTGLDPLDPANEKATIDYALKHASQHGWKPWHGAAKVGVGEYDGIGAGAQAAATDQAVAPAQQSDASTQVKGTDTSTMTPNTGVDSSPAATGAATSDFLGKLQDPKTGAAAGIGEAISGLGQAVAGTGLNKGMYDTAAPVRTIAAPGMMTPKMAPTVDPRIAEQQRQQLAMAMQKLNSGRLY